MDESIGTEPTMQMEMHDVGGGQVAGRYCHWMTVDRERERESGHWASLHDRRHCKGPAKRERELVHSLFCTASIMLVWTFARAKVH